MLKDPMYHSGSDLGPAEEEKETPISSPPQEETHTQVPSTKKTLEIKKGYLTINTCFEPSTPVEKPMAHVKAASTKSHLRAQQQQRNLPILPPHKSISSVVCNSKPKHFVFSEHLFSPHSAFSPNRPLLFTEFLIRKLGKEVFDRACQTLREEAGDPVAMLENEPAKLLAVIGEENAQCIQVFKYIISSNVSTPLHSQLSSQQLVLLQQHHARTRSMQTPDAFMSKIPRLVHMQNYPQTSTHAKPRSTTAAQAGGDKGFMISPSAATDVSSSPAEASPKTRYGSEDQSALSHQTAQ